MEESRRDGIETIEGIRRIKAELPGVSTILGLSNVSFGLNPAARQVLNSVFLHECVEAGLDARHRPRVQDPAPRPDRRAGPRGLPRPGLRPPARGLRPAARSCSRLFEGASATAAAREEHRDWPVERRLEQRIVDGDRNGLEADLDEALAAGHAGARASSTTSCWPA